MTSPNSPDVDYRVYTEGKLKPYHGKTIKHLIAKHKDYLVYLDDDLYVWWSIKDSYKPEAVSSASFGEVLNRVSWLEAIEVSNLLKDRWQHFDACLAKQSLDCWTLRTLSSRMMCLILR